jgi:hypothetical protein
MRHETGKERTRAIVYLSLFLFTLLCSLLLQPHQVSALGVAPSSKDIPYEAGKDITFPLKIVNSEKVSGKVVIFIDGELASYFNLSSDIVEFTSGEEDKIISVSLHMPETMEKQGPQTTSIILRRLSASQSTVSASVSVVSQINIMVPYSGKYSRIKFYTSSFETNSPSNFVIEAENLGDADIIKSKVIVDIYGTMNEKIETISSDEKRIDAKDKVLFTIPWTPKLKHGSYYAISTLIYDDKTTEDKKGFNIGEPRVDIKSISVTNFKLGGIAKFDLVLENDWNTKIDDITGIVYISDKDKIYTTSKTEAVNLGSFESKEINAYWDTQKVITGKYMLKVVMQYLGKEDTKDYDIYVSDAEITTTPSGNVVGGGATGTGTGSSIDTKIIFLIILVIIVIIINVFILMKKFKKEKKEMGGKDTSSNSESSAKQAPTAKQGSNNDQKTG